MFELNKIYNVDSYEAIKNIPDKSIDLIITDPPYQIDTIGGKTGSNLCKNITKTMDELKEADIIDGLNTDILEQFMRVMKKPNIYIWCNKKQIPDYLEFFVKKHKCKFEIMVWCKTNPIPAFGGNYLNDKEFCLYFRKNIKLATKYETAFTYWVSKCNIEDKKLYFHPTIKPLNIIEKLVLNSTKENDVILDTFCGSGTTCVAAKKHNRNFIGFEINKKYVDISNKRLEKVVAIKSNQEEINTKQMSIFDYLEEENNGK